MTLQVNHSRTLLFCFWKWYDEKLHDLMNILKRLYNIDYLSKVVKKKLVQMYFGISIHSDTFFHDFSCLI